MGFFDPHEGAAASTFLVLYFLLWLCACYVVKNKGFKSNYTFIFTFCLIRLAAQLCAVVFAKLGYEHINWLIAYLILGAEGFFTLILATFCFLAYAEYITTGTSVIKPSKEEIKRQYPTRIERTRATIRSPTFLFHIFLIPANALVIAGGSKMAGVDPEDAGSSDQVNTAKGLRAAGQAMFLIQIFIVLLTALYLIFKRNIRIYMVYACFAAWFPLLVRGIYGILSVFLHKLNYFDLSNYTATGISSTFLATEYVLGTTMEYIAALCLISTYFIRNPHKGKTENIEAQ